MDEITQIQVFVKKYCPYQNHYCNGKHIPSCIQRINKWYDVDRTKDREQPCEYFIDGKCTHQMRHEVGRIRSYE